MGEAAAPESCQWNWQHFLYCRKDLNADHTCMLAYNHPFTLKESKTYQRRHLQRNKDFHALDKNFSALVLKLHMPYVSVLLKMLPPHNYFSPVLLLNMQILGCYSCTTTINIFWKDSYFHEKNPHYALKVVEKNDILISQNIQYHYHTQTAKSLL